MVLKRSGDQPISNNEIAALDLSAERIWPAARVVDLRGWRCRIDQGVTRRANSVLALGSASVDQLSEAEKLYRASKLRPVFQITPAAGGDALDSVLAGCGYVQEGGAIVERLSLESMQPGAARGEDLQFTPNLDPDWLQAYGQDQSEQEFKAKAAILKRIRASTTFAAIGPQGGLKAVGLCVLDGRLGWINCMYTNPNYRRQGLGRRIIAGLCAQLRDLGASSVYLQVEADNVGARTLYDGFGFEELYRYHYRAAGELKAQRVEAP